MSDPHPTLEQIFVHLEYLKDGVDGINSRLDAQNGRIRTTETEIAVLKDRSEGQRKTSGAWGAGGGFVGGLLAAFVQGWLSGK